MLKIYIDSDEYPIWIDGKDWYIAHAYDGYDSLCFELSDTHEMYPFISEEAIVSDGHNLYSVKQIDDHGGYMSVTCALNLDDWRKRFWRSYRRTDSSLQQVFDDIKPSGWILEGAENINKHATIEASEGQGLENVIAETILSRASEVYEVTFNFDVLNKTVRVIDPAGYTPSGDYLTDELNLKTLGYTGNTKEFATRLYAYGKKDNSGNPVTIASVNGGKEYIDNNQYSNRVISVGWSDERYTSPQSLFDAAKEKLDSLSYPVRSYECDVRNLDENMYMYKVVTLIDRKHNKRTDHRVISYKEYPEAHYYDEVTLSAVPPKIEGTVKSISAEIDRKMAASVQVASDAVLTAMKVITGATGGHVKILMEEGLPEAIEVTHSDGTKTLADVDGVSRNGCDYLYLIQQGTLTVNPGETAKIQLSESWIGHDAEISIGMRTVEPQNDTDVLHSISFDQNWNKSTATANVTAVCDMISIESKELVAPKKIEIGYCIIGR